MSTEEQADWIFAIASILGLCSWPTDFAALIHSKDGRAHSLVSAGLLLIMVCLCLWAELLLGLYRAMVVEMLHLLSLLVHISLIVWYRRRYQVGMVKKKSPELTGA
jgi:hypothetical protein